MHRSQCAAVCCCCDALHSEAHASELAVATQLEMGMREAQEESSVLELEVTSLRQALRTASAAEAAAGARAQQLEALFASQEAAVSEAEQRAVEAAAQGMLGSEMKEKEWEGRERALSEKLLRLQEELRAAQHERSTAVESAAVAEASRREAVVRAEQGVQLRLEAEQARQLAEREILKLEAVGCDNNSSSSVQLNYGGSGGNHRGRHSSSDRGEKEGKKERSRHGHGGRGGSAADSAAKKAAPSEREREREREGPHRLRDELDRSLAAHQLHRMATIEQMMQEANGLVEQVAAAQREQGNKPHIPHE